MNPFEQGYEAARRGVPNWHNPYHVHTHKADHELWEAGWRRWGRNLLTVR